MATILPHVTDKYPAAGYTALKTSIMAQSLPSRVAGASFHAGRAAPHHGPPRSSRSQSSTEQDCTVMGQNNGTIPCASYAWHCSSPFDYFDLQHTSTPTRHAAVDPLQSMASSSSRTTHPCPCDSGLVGEGAGVGRTRRELKTRSDGSQLSHAPFCSPKPAQNPGSNAITAGLKHRPGTALYGTNLPAAGESARTYK